MTLTEAEKQEILTVAASVQFRDDMERMRRNHPQCRQNTPDVDAYIQFLDATHAMLGHPRKTFIPITGDHFLL